MEKLLICDICGTSYADTEEKCPTCGYARAFDLESLYSERPSVTHTKVRGGRYSKKNVQKRLQELEKAAQAKMEMQAEAEQEPVEEAPVEPVSEEIILPEEIVIPEEEVVVIPEEVAGDEEEIVESPEEESPAEEEPAEIVEVIPEDVEEAFPAEPVAEAIDFEFPEDEPQEAVQDQEEELVLEIPEEIGFQEEVLQDSEKESKSRNLWLNLALGFASVVFALSALYLVITYAVPAVKEMLPVADPTVVATEAPTTEPTEAEEVLVLNFTTLTFTRAEDSSKVFAIGLSDREIVWSSDDAAVASVNEAGLITAVGPGTTTIHAVYGELEAVVTVTCDFE